MKKLLLSLCLLLAPCLLPAQTNTFPATGSANTFSQPNTFQVGVQLGPVTFANLPAGASNGRLILCSDCQLANPCASGGTGAFAQRVGGAWNCASGGAGGSTVNVNGSSVASPNFNAASPSPDAGFTAATFKVSGSNVILEVPQVTINAASPLGGGGTLLPGGTLNLTCTGCALSGLTSGFVPIAMSPTAIGNSLLDYGVTNASQFTMGAALNFSGAGTALWQATSGTCITPSTTNIYVSFCGGALQESIGMAGFSPLVQQNNIAGGWINSCCITANFLNAGYASGDTFFTVANGSGNTLAAVTAAADIATSVTGAGLCTDANGNATTLGCPAGAGAANTSLSNVVAVTAFGSNFGFAAGFGTISTSTNGNLILAPNGTGIVVFNSGAINQPSFGFSGDTATGQQNGFYSGGAGVVCYETGAAGSQVPKFCIKSTTGSTLPSSLGFGWSSTTNATGAPDTCLNRISAGVVGIGTTCSTGSFTGNLQLAKILNYNGIATAGIGVPAVYGTPIDLVAQSTTTTQTLVTSVPANGLYRIGYSLSQNAVCTSGSNSVALTFTWTDDASIARTYSSSSLTLGTTNPATAHLEAEIPAFLKSASTVSTTITVTGTCTTGTSSFNFHSDVFQTH